MNKNSAMLLAALLTVQAAHSAVSYTGSYSQNFDSLAAAGTGNAWANDSTLTGWYLYQGGGTAITTYNAGDGASGTGNFYSFGTASSSDRALGGVASSGAYFGSPASGALAGYIAVAIQNTSGSTLDNFTLSFDGEQWRNGGNVNAQTMALQYGFGSTFATVTTWNSPGGLFDYASPVHTATSAAVDGNSAGKVTGLGGTISSLSWNDGDTLWVRWVENNDVGNDHGLAIDNLTITTNVPEPSTIALASLGGLGCLMMFRRKC